MYKIFIILCIICGVGIASAPEDTTDSQYVKVEKNNKIYVFRVDKIYHSGDLIPYHITYYDQNGVIAGELTRNITE